jgi:hypothetical protein
MSTKWAIALVIAVVAVGSGIGYVTLIRPARQRPADTRPQASAGPRPRDPGPTLRIEDKEDLVTAEPVLEGHRDMPFRNPGDRPLTVRLKETDCGCAHVQLCVAPAAWHELDSQQLVTRSGDPALAWQKLEKDGEGFTVPPRASGLLRLGWKTTQLGHHRFWAGLLVDDGGEPGYQRVEVPVHFVEPVRIRTEDDPNRTEIDVGRIGAGEERTARFLCFSLTRDKFTLTPSPAAADPCVSYGTPQPLTGEELEALSHKQDAAVRAACRVTVTVRERAGAARLDLGPFRRPLAWKTEVDTGFQVSAHVSGTVQGEVALAAPGDGAFVDLGTVSATDPKPLVCTLEGRDPQLELSVDGEKTVDFLKVELLDGKEGSAAGSGKRWRVRVLFRADSLFRGKFPERDRPGYDSPDLCSLVFIVARPGPGDQPVRRLFVPVRGNVTMGR